jgi:hemerythrin
MSMDELGWSEQYAVGVESIDDEHKELFAAVGKIKEAMTRSAEQAETVELLQKLASATGKHFADEEALMRAAKYPGIELHVANHRRLVQKIDAFVARHKRIGAPMDEHAWSFLRDWLVYHIENDDLRLGNWLQDRFRELAHMQHTAQSAQQCE